MQRNHRAKQSAPFAAGLDQQFCPSGDPEHPWANVDSGNVVYSSVPWDPQSSYWDVTQQDWDVTQQVMDLTQPGHMPIEDSYPAIPYLEGPQSAGEAGQPPCSSFSDLLDLLDGQSSSVQDLDYGDVKALLDVPPVPALIESFPYQQSFAASGASKSSSAQPSITNSDDPWEPVVPALYTSFEMELPNDYSAKADCQHSDTFLNPSDSKHSAPSSSAPWQNTPTTSKKRKRNAGGSGNRNGRAHHGGLQPLMRPCVDTAYVNGASYGPNTTFTNINVEGSYQKSTQELAWGEKLVPSGGKI